MSISFAPIVTTPKGSLEHPRIHSETVSFRDEDQMPALTPAVSALPASHLAPECPSSKRQATSWVTHKSKNPEPGRRASSPIPDSRRPSLILRKISSLTSRKAKPSNTTQEDPTPEPKLLPGPRYEPSPVRHYKPATEQNEKHGYVLTLKMTESISEPVNAIRQQYFPKHLNRLPAHVTLFHALPYSQLDKIQADLEAVPSSVKPFSICTGQPFRTGRGVGITCDLGLKEAQALQEMLRENWLEYLSTQDRAVEWVPHWTVMNKVANVKEVRSAFNTIRRDLFENIHYGRAIGLDLWRYDKGDWIWEQTFDFADQSNSGEIKASLVKAPGGQGAGDDFDMRPRPGGKRNGKQKA